MRISDAFPSKYFRPSDVPADGQLLLVMEEVQFETMEGDGGKVEKPVVRFRGEKKGFVLNKVNADTIKGTYGDDCDAWFGQRIALYVTPVEFGGKTMPGLRVRIPPAAASSSHATVARRATGASRAAAPSTFADANAELAGVSEEQYDF